MTAVMKVETRQYQ